MPYSKFGSAGSICSRVSDSPSGDEGEGHGEYEYSCFACLKPDTLQNLPDCIGDRLFHRPCTSGIRSYRRTLPNTTEARLKYQHTFLHNPTQWRQDVGPFLNLDTRKAARTEQKRKLFEESRTDKVNAHEDIKDTLLLSLTQFKAHVGFWERLSDTDAKAKFEKLHSEQRKKHDKDGVARVAYKDVERVRDRSGTEQRDGVVDQHHVDHLTHELKRRRLVSKCPQAAAPAHYRAPSSAASAAVASLPASPGGESDQEPTPPKTGKTAKTARKEELAAEEREELIKMAAPSKLSPKEFLQRRDLAVASCMLAISDIDGKKGVLTELDRFIEAAKEGSLDADLHKKTPAIRAPLLKVKDQLNDLKAKAESMDRDNLIKTETDIETAVQHAKSLHGATNDHREGLAYQKDNAKKAARKKYLADRHKMTTYRDSMLKTNFSKPLATFNANRVFKMGMLVPGASDKLYADPQAFPGIDLTEINFDQVGLWLKDSGKGEIPDAIRAASEEAAVTIKELAEKSEVAMLKNKTWNGCVVCSEKTKLELQIIAGHAPFFQDQHVMPWVTTGKKWVYRFGPKSHPLIGCCHFVQSFSGTWVVSLVSVQALLQQGIVLKDFENFVKSDAGASFLEESSVTLCLEAGGVMLIPFGFVAMTTLVNDHKNDANSGHLVFFPVLSEKLAAKLPENVWASVVQVNTDYYKTNPNAMKGQAASFAAFVEEVAKSSK